MSGTLRLVVGLEPAAPEEDDAFLHVDVRAVRGTEQKQKQRDDHEDEADRREDGPRGLSESISDERAKADADEEQDEAEHE
jgi:hypothetical protein